MRSQAAVIEREGAWATEPGALRRLAPLFLAGGLAGVLAGGLGSRIAMRIAALAAPGSVQGLRTEAEATIGRISLDGTLFLVLVAGIASALIGTAFYRGVRAWLPSRRWPRALAFGGLELVVFGTVILDQGNPDFTILGHPMLNVVVFGSLFVLHGVLLVVLQRPARRLVDATGRGIGWREALVNVATVGAAALTALGAVGVALQGGGWWNRLWMLTLFAARPGSFIAPSRGDDHPADLRVVGGVFLREAPRAACALRCGNDVVATRSAAVRLRASLSAVIGRTSTAPPCPARGDVDPRSQHRVVTSRMPSTLPNWGCPSGSSAR
jgi:hypothetical protein